MTESSRNYAIDGLRAIAALLGIAVHASTSYALTSVIGWPSFPKHSVFFDILASGIHSFRVPIFFFIAGFLSYFSYRNNTIHTFIKHRLFRIVLPFLIFLPLTNFPYLAANFILHRINSINDFLYLLGNAGYLWFLEYLIFYYAITILVIYICKKISTDDIHKIDLVFSNFLKKRYFSFFILFNYLFLYALKVWYTPIYLSLIPSFLLLFYALSFFLGWFLCRYNLLFVFFKFEKKWVFYAAIGYVGYILIFLYSAHSELSRILALFFYVIMGWYLFFIFVSVSLRLFQQKNAIISYLAEASYWIYLVHIPLLFYVQQKLLITSLPLFVQFIVSWFATLVLCLTTYRLVRNTWIGRGPTVIRQDVIAATSEDERARSFS